MKRTIVVLLASAVIATGISSCAEPEKQSVLSYHGHSKRSGNFVVPALTRDRARSLHLDEGFRPLVSGHVYAQPLYWRAPGSNSAILILATEDNVVQAIDAGTGTEVWKRSLGRAVARSSLPCGNIDPLGVTGTPVIDGGSEVDVTYGSGVPDIGRKVRSISATTPRGWRLSNSRFVGAALGLRFWRGSLGDAL